jgi:proline iminopeptidase
LRFVGGSGCSVPILREKRGRVKKHVLTRSGIALALLAGCISLFACSESGPEAGSSQYARGDGALLEINGTELFVRRIGEGEPILVVHGGPVLEHGYLLPHLEPLAEDYELTFYDQRVSGRSAGVVDSSTLTIGAFVEDMEEVRSALGLGRVHLMAHSWGGLLAMRYALAHEDQLRSLILLSPMSASSALWREEEAVRAASIPLGHMIERADILESEAFAEGRPEAFQALLRLSFRTQFHDPARLDELEFFIPDDFMGRSDQFRAMIQEVESFDIHEDLSRLAVPALLVYGSDEPGAELGGAAIQEALAGSRMEIVQEAGHFPFIEQPHTFLSLVREFLSSF